MRNQEGNQHGLKPILPKVSEADARERASLPAAGNCATKEKQIASKVGWALAHADPA